MTLSDGFEPMAAIRSVSGNPVFFNEFAVAPALSRSAPGYW